MLLISGCSGSPRQNTPNPVSEPSPAPAGQTTQQTAQTAPELPAVPELPGALLVMVDNHHQAYPQSGLDKADMVFEILAEGGITRFMALYYHRKADKIGPVRSARYYFVQLAKGLDSPLAHAGGNMDALELIGKIKMKDLDEIYNSADYFWRDNSRNMPHNLYTSTEKLVQGAQDRKLSLVAPPVLPAALTFTGEAHKNEIVLDYGRSGYKAKVSWLYQNGSYERQQNGAKHVMTDGAGIKAFNIIVLAAKTQEVTKEEENESEITLIGKGSALYFTDGLVSKGTWEKSAVQGQLKFLDEKGAAKTFKPGITWVQVVPGLATVSF